MNRRILVGVLGLGLLSGCAAAVVGGAAAAGATWVWFKGNLKDTVAVPLPAAEPAVRQALAGLEMVGIEGHVEGLEGRVTALTGDGKRVTVRLQALDFERTEVRIRVGTLGSRPISMQILRHIHAEVADR
jgi:hypothetical protein